MTSFHEQIQVLLIEDDEEDAKLTIRALKKHRLTNLMHHVEDGEEALEFFFSQGQYSDKDINNQPNLVLLDLKLPKVSGLEVLQAIKSNDLTKDIPVVALTSSKEDSDVKECYKLGVNSYIVKPVEFDKFVQAVTELGFYWLVMNEPPKK